MVIPIRDDTGANVRGRPPQLRGRGIGSALLAAAETEARHRRASDRARQTAASVSEQGRNLHVICERRSYSGQPFISQSFLGRTRH